MDFSVFKHEDTRQKLLKTAPVFAKPTECVQFVDQNVAVLKLWSTDSRGSPQFDFCFESERQAICRSEISFDWSEIIKSHFSIEKCLNPLRDILFNVHF